MKDLKRLMKFLLEKNVMHTYTQKNRLHLHSVHHGINRVGCGQCNQNWKCLWWKRCQKKKFLTSTELHQKYLSSSSSSYQKHTFESNENVYSLFRYIFILIHLGVITLQIVSVFLCILLWHKIIAYIFGIQNTIQLIHDNAKPIRIFKIVSHTEFLNFQFYFPFGVQ